MSEPAAPPSRNVLKRALRPAVHMVDRVIERRGSAVFPRRAEVDHSLEKVYHDLVEATTDVKRWLADDLDANAETAALLGRSLSRLTDAVGQLSEQVAALGERLDRIEAAVAGTPVDARSTTE